MKEIMIDIFIASLLGFIAITIWPDDQKLFIVVGETYFIGVIADEFYVKHKNRIKKLEFGIKSPTAPA